jgi:transposase-like protein
MDTRRPGWRPPHCPNPNCTYHKRIDDRWRYKRKGFFVRLGRPHRIQRFVCLSCRRTFSTQTFSTTYWQKRPALTAAVLPLVVGAMANRQMARALGAAPSSIAHHISRLARHCMLLHTRQFEGVVPREIAIDGFESFEWSQYFPFHHHVAVDVETGYFLYHTDSPLRRKGRMTPAQKRRREELEALHGRPDPRSVRQDVQELLERVCQRCDHLTVRSDDHRAYPPAIRALPCPTTHRVTSSRARRDRANPLFEVNLLDGFVRHSTAAHRRETIAWAKRRQASAEKLSIFQLWRNCMKRRWEKGPPVSSAMLAGVTNRLWQVRDVLAQRRFATRIDLPRRWRLYYERGVETVVFAVNRRHQLRFAF